MQGIGKFLIIAGIIVVLIGVVLNMGWGRAAFGWMGHLPGDIRIEREGFSLFFPLTTGILLSVVITLILRLILFLRGM